MQTDMSSNRMFYLSVSIIPGNSICLQAEDVSEKEAYM